VSSFFTARLARLPLGLKGGTEEKAGFAVDSISDEALLTRLQAGEKPALDFLFQRYSRIIRGIGARILRDSTEAEDLVQDVFLFIHQKCGIFDGSKSSARSWIVQMAYHRAIERRRHLAHRRFYSQVGLEHHTAPLVGTPTTEVDYSAEAVFGRNGLHRVLRALSEHQRETLRLHFFEGYTLSEVARELGQSLGNVRHHYYRALDKIRKQVFGNKVPADGNHAK
jgi:RNA polymerase sigma-70 factor (ECF subfamily)